MARPVSRPGSPSLSLPGSPIIHHPPTPACVSLRAWSSLRHKPSTSPTVSAKSSRRSCASSKPRKPSFASSSKLSGPCHIQRSCACHPSVQRATCCVRPLPTAAPSPGLALRGAIEQKEADHKKQQAEADQEIDNTKAKIQVTSWIVDLGSHSSLKFYPVVILLTTETTATRLYSSVSRRRRRFAPRRCPRSRQ